MISREEAIDILHEKHSENEFYFAEYDDYPEGIDGNFQNALLMAIEALSHERPKGRWVVENEDSIRCPECCYNRARIKHPLNFCPECGCDMRGEEE